MITRISRQTLCAVMLLPFVGGRADELLKNGEFSAVKRIRFTALANQESEVLDRAERSVATGFVLNNATGLASRLVAQRLMGTSVQVTPRVIDDKTVFAKVLIRDDRPFTPSDGAAVAKDADGPIMLPEILSSSVKTGRQKQGLL